MKASALSNLENCKVISLTSILLLSEETGSMSMMRRKLLTVICAFRLSLRKLKMKESCSLCRLIRFIRRHVMLLLSREMRDEPIKSILLSLEGILCLEPTDRTRLLK